MFQWRSSYKQSRQNEGTPDRSNLITRSAVSKHRPDRSTQPPHKGSCCGVGGRVKATTPNLQRNRPDSIREAGPANRAATASAVSRGGSPTSHEIRLSDGSDDEDQTPQAATCLDEDLCAGPRLHHSGQATGRELSGSHQAEQKDPSTNTARRRMGPAAALSSQVVVAAKRRVKRALPPAVATVHAAPTAAATAATAAATAGHLAREDEASPTDMAASATSESAAGGPSHQLRRRLALAGVVPFAVIALAIAAAAAVAALRLPGGGFSPHQPNAAAPFATRRLPFGRTAGQGTDGWTPYGGTAAAGVSSAVAGGWIRRTLSYLTGSTWHSGAARSKRGGAALTAAAATEVSAAWGGGRPDGVLGLMQPLRGRPPVPVAGSGGGGGGGRVSGSGSGSGRHAPSVSVASIGSGGGGAGGGEGLIPVAGHPETEWRESATVRVITVVSGRPSAYRTSWDSLVDHTAQRLEWTDPAYQMLVFPEEQLGADQDLQSAFLLALEGGAHIVAGFDVTDPGTVAFLRDPRVTSKLPGVVLFAGGSEPLACDLTRLQGGLRPQDAGSWRTALARQLTWTPDGRGLAVWDTVQLLLGRHDSDNFLFVYLVLINQYVTTVRQVADTTKGFDLQSIFCMIKNCGQKVVGCVQDPTCKSALDCLNSCSFNDQVCQYRCIVSYESPLLEQFSLCILQLHNCRNLHAQPPLLPDPSPMPSFRGDPLTHEAAEDLFIGWLDEPGQGAPAGSHLGERPGKQYSWLVAGGKNPAYDYFPCQHQLYYRGRGRSQMWYEPVFKAITLDGREVWRRRVYRVRRGQLPGTFHLSVLDNGVTSNEFWRILDCEEDLAYCLFYYSGAASTAGLSYSGAVLGTPDGRMPGPQHTARLHSALRRAGIEPWEVSFVDNSNCGGVPLQITGPVAAPVAAA